MPQVVIAATFTARPGCQAALEAEAARMVDPTRAEPGCLRYDLFRHPAGIAFLETWESPAALEAHRASPHIQAWRAASAGLVDRRDVHTLEPLGDPGPGGAGPVAVLALVTALPGREAALAQELAGMVAPTRLEPGCLRYDLHRDPADPATLAFLEAWASQGDLESHLGTPAFAASRGRQKALVATAEIRLLEPIRA